MRQIVLAFLLLLTSQVNAANLSVLAADAGEHYQFTHTTSQIHITNHGTEKAIIQRITPFRSKDQVFISPREVEPGATVTIPVELFLGNDLGNRWHSFEVFVDQDAPGAHLAQVHVFGMSILDEPRPLIDFGVVNTDQESQQQSIRFSSQDVVGIKAVQLLAVPKAFIAGLSEDGLAITVSINPVAHWGRHDEFIKVATNSLEQPEIWVEVRADVHGAIVPSSNPYELGVMRKNAKNEFLIRLDNKAGKKFRVGKLLLEGIKGQVHLDTCSPKQKGCRLLRLLVDANQPTGKIVGKLLVELPEFKQVIPIDLWGMLLKSDTSVVSLDDKLNAAKDTQGIGQSSVTTSTDLKAMIKKAMKSEPSKDNTPLGAGPLLKWNVANEQLVYGYIVYRSDQEKGPFFRVKTPIIRVFSDERSGDDYQWRDITAESGKTYWYYIGLVNNDGTKKQLSSPQKIVAK